MSAGKELTRLARFMTRWLGERGMGEWIVVAQVERDRSYSKRFRLSRGRMLRRGRLWLTDRATMRRRRRPLASGIAFVADDETAWADLLAQCWKALGAKSVEEVALRWAVLGDDAVLRWLGGTEPAVR